MTYPLGNVAGYSYTYYGKYSNISIYDKWICLVTVCMPQKCSKNKNLQRTALGKCHLPHLVHRILYTIHLIGITEDTNDSPHCSPLKLPLQSVEAALTHNMQSDYNAAKNP